MTQEEKDLLITDLCSRLEHGVVGRVYTECSTGEYDVMGDMIFVDKPFDVILDGINLSTGEIQVTAIGNEDTVNFIDEQQDAAPFIIEDFEPYLRPMSSMTEEEEDELNSARMGNYGEDVDWLNKKMFDYRGLLPKKLALIAKEGMYKTE